MAILLKSDFKNLNKKIPNCDLTHAEQYQFLPTLNQSIIHPLKIPYLH